MILRLSLLCSLLSASALAAADEPKRDPNYTGPSAPTVILPDMALPASQSFAHPGILHSQADLDFVRARLAAGEEPWTSALRAMRADKYCQLTIKAKAVPVIDPHGQSAGYPMMDASAAYGHALLWCLTGERAHADKAIELLNANSAILQSIDLGRNDQGKIEAGFTAGKYAAAAELLAHYRQPDGSAVNWPPAEIERFRQMLTTVFYPRIENFKPEFNGNWDASMVASMMAIGVFCDDHAKFNRALDYYLHGKGHGSISHYVYASGQNQESGRDQAHAQLGLGALAAACEIARQQGLDLYSVAGNRLAAGYEYLAKYQTGHEVEMVGPVPISEHGRKTFMPIFEIAYQHYAVEKGLPMPFTKDLLDHHRPEGIDLIILQAWGTLTHYRGPAISSPSKP